MSNNTFFLSETEDIVNIIEYTKNSIDDKFDNINIHSTLDRPKRGLINGLGSMVKTITGNLDSEDGERINSIMEHLKQNQENLQTQIKMQYSVSHQIIDNFNKTIQDIQYNEKILKTKIFEIRDILDFQANAENIIYLKQLFNELLITFNVILDVLERVENSLTFCKLKTLHPSIIKSEDLFAELQNVHYYYQTELPFELKHKNILEFEAVIDVVCKVENNQIQYFLSIPINYDILFNLFYMLPIPTEIESEYVTLIPNSKFLLKSNNVIKPLNDICTRGNIFQCPNNLQDNNNYECEENILLAGNSTFCPYTKIEIIKNHIEIIPKINQFLAIFPVEEKSIIKCKQETEVKTLKGIYLIENSACKIIFRNQELIFQQNTFGQPFVINELNLKLNQLHVSPMKIDLKSLRIKDIPNQLVTPIFTENHNLHIPSIWTILLYTALIVAFLWIMYKRKHSGRTSKSHLESMEDGIQLPGEASF